MTVLVASDALVAGEVRVVRLESALGPCVQGLHEKREKVPHPGLQHVRDSSDVGDDSWPHYALHSDSTQHCMGTHCETRSDPLDPRYTVTLARHTATGVCLCVYLYQPCL